MNIQINVYFQRQLVKKEAMNLKEIKEGILEEEKERQKFGNII